MRPDASVELRLVRSGAGPPIRSGIRRRFRVVVVLCVTGAIAVGYWKVAGRRADDSLPGEQRNAIFQRSFDELTQTCGGHHPRGLLEEHCRELASFVSRFEDCREECEAVVRARLAPTPTR